MAAYQYAPPRGNPLAGSIAQLLSEQGDIRARQALTIGEAQARAAQTSGDAWGRAISGIGQTLGAIPQQIQQQKQQATQQALQTRLTESQIGSAEALTQQRQQETAQAKADREALDKVFATPGGLEKALEATPGHLRDQVMKDYQQANTLAKQAREASDAARKQRLEYLGAMASRIRANNYDPGYALGVLHHARNTFADDPQFIEQVDQMRMGVIEQPESIREPVDWAIANSSFREELKPKAPIKLGAGETLLESETFKPLVTAPTAPASMQSENVLLDGKSAKVNFNPKTGKYLLPDGSDVSERVKPIPPQAAVNVGLAKDDASAIADAIEAGAQPPDTAGLFRLAGPVRAELARRGYDYTKANLDYQGAKRFVSTLNGPQQTRLRQAISTASNSLGVIEDLATQWEGGKFPLLNRAQLTAATNGALGSQAQQIATNLQAQITDVVSELGNVYMGGNSPTDHALQLAGKNLSADWTKAQLLSAVKLARENLRIRANSMTSLGAAGMGGAIVTPEADPLGLGIVRPKK